jgi:hypothetical protein
MFGMTPADHIMADVVTGDYIERIGIQTSEPDLASDFGLCVGHPVLASGF